MTAAPARLRLARFLSLGSTMDAVRAEAAAGAPGWSAVTAVEQTGGRGRRGRVWASPPGNLYLSLLLRPPDLGDGFAWLPFAVGLALHDAVAPLLPDAVQGSLRLKWPNDLLLNGAKLAGILIEAERDGEGALSAVILGIGLNIASAPAPEPAGYATASLHTAGCDVAVDAVLDPLLAALQARIAEAAAAPDALRLAWLERAAGLGGPLTVRLPHEAFTGTFTGIDASGALLLRQPAGERRVLAGDVFLGAAVPCSSQ